METEAEAPTPIFLRYWMWTGDTLLRARSLMSRAARSVEADRSTAGS